MISIGQPLSSASAAAVVIDALSSVFICGSIVYHVQTHYTAKLHFINGTVGVGVGQIQ